MVKQKVAGGALLLLFCFFLSAEESHKIILDSSVFGIRLADSDWGLFSTSSGEIDFSSRGNKDVKARFAIKAESGQLVSTNPVTYEQNLTGQPISSISIHYAYIKAKIPVTEEYDIRISAGKNAISWGSGALFNSGNTAFSSISQSSNLLAVGTSVREDTAWYQSLYLPLSKYSFIEQLLIIPEKGMDSSHSPATIFPSPEKSIPAIRTYFKLGQLSTELSYLYNPSEKTHTPAITLQGNLLGDIYISASTSVKDDSIQLYNNLAISCGIFFLNPIEIGETISLRLEALIIPSASWQEETYNAGSTKYGLQIYQEAIIAPTDRLSFILRSITSPIDLSALIITGTDFNLSQNLHIYAFFSAQAGEKSDTYSIDKPAGIGLAAGLRYTF
ncbi:hypothetical protein WKV44_03175 [Spirochaetia bacterium 38H-sp]|uniref:Porin n=1 Tax=Rarispira pelagica TaxID=3141764 RepID=A0ABU9UA42_9SPIR